MAGGTFLGRSGRLACFWKLNLFERKGCQEPPPPFGLGRQGKQTACLVETAFWGPVARVKDENVILSFLASLVEFLLTFAPTLVRLNSTEHPRYLAMSRSHENRFNSTHCRRRREAYLLRL